MPNNNKFILFIFVWILIHPTHAHHFCDNQKGVQSSSKPGKYCSDTNLVPHNKFFITILVVLMTGRLHYEATGRAFPAT